jgi:hypothetical protein
MVAVRHLSTYVALCALVPFSPGDANATPQERTVQSPHAAGNVTQAQGCPPIDRALLRRRLEGGMELPLHFFSTWCSECAEGLTALKGVPGDTYLAIATFDTQAKVEKTLAKLGLAVSCAMDDGLARELGVKVVPARRIITLGAEGQIVVTPGRLP